MFFIETCTRRACLGGITRHPDADWMEQVARNAAMQDTGYLNGCRYLLHDRDQKFCREFRETLAAFYCAAKQLEGCGSSDDAERVRRSLLSGDEKSN